MLNQLNRLSIVADGRYATESELQFLKDYLQTVDLRVQAYEKIREAEEPIINELDSRVRAANPDLFRDATEEYMSFCFRDRKSVVRLSAAAMLMEDLDNLRNGFLCWYRTIINAFSYQRAAEINYKVLPSVLAEHLDAQEMQLLQPALRLDQSILGES
jgi:Phycobilisome protein